MVLEVGLKPSDRKAAVEDRGGRPRRPAPVRHGTPVVCNRHPRRGTTPS